MKRVAVALALLATTFSAAAQERRPTLGLGIGIVPLEVAGFTPTIEVYLPLLVAPGFRLEPSLGVFTNDRRQGETDRSDVTLGIGAFFVSRVAASTDAYVGGRLKLNFASVDSPLASDSETDVVLAAAVGGEQYLASHLSLGAEAQLGHYQNGRVSAAQAFNDSGFFTTGIAFLRVYFQ